MQDKADIALIFKQQLIKAALTQRKFATLSILIEGSTRGYCTAPFNYFHVSLRLFLQGGRVTLVLELP